MEIRQRNQGGYPALALYYSVMSRLFSGLDGLDGGAGEGDERLDRGRHTLGRLRHVDRRGPAMAGATGHEDGENGGGRVSMGRETVVVVEGA